MLKRICSRFFVLFYVCVGQAKPHWSGILKIRGLGWQANYDISVIEKAIGYECASKINTEHWRGGHVAHPYSKSGTRFWELKLLLQLSLKKEDFLFTIVGIVLWKAYMCVCVCVYVRERERFWLWKWCFFEGLKEQCLQLYRNGLSSCPHALCTREYIDQTWRCKLGGGVGPKPKRANLSSTLGWM